MPFTTRARNLVCGLAAFVTAFSFSMPVTLAQNSDLPWRHAAGGNDAYEQNGAADDAYRPPSDTGDSYSPDNDRRGHDSFSGGRSTGVPEPDGYGEPYRAPSGGGGDGYPTPQGPPQQQSGYRGYEQGEIVGAGHRFFGSISQGLASAVEYVFKSQGRPNGYILGQDAGGAFVVGLRYGEGTLYTKDAGDHRVFWQGPTIGYDAGAEGSKTMTLVYNMRDPAEIYRRFGGVEGSAYLVGGVSVVFQKYGDITLAVIRSGLGLRLGANVGYLKYTRSPTWNPL